MNNLALKKLSLIDEVRTSVKLLKKGMGDLQSIDGTNDFYHAPLLLLSSGYERLIKCLICLALMDDSMEYKRPPFETSRSKGHDLVLLLDTLMAVCENKKYSYKFPAAKVDVDFLSKDKDLRKIICLLSKFAQGARYYNLDIVLKGKSGYEDPATTWQKIELAILKKQDLLEKHNYSDTVHTEVNNELIITLEKFARALSRLFTLADFGDFAKQASPSVYDYLMLTDNDLGTTDYRIS